MFVTWIAKAEGDPFLKLAKTTQMPNLLLKTLMQLEKCIKMGASFMKSTNISICAVDTLATLS